MRGVSRKRPLSLSTQSRAALMSIEEVSRAIVVLRGRRVLLDAELATLYGVTTKRLNEQVKRNAERFPEDFMFRLSRAEIDALNRSHSATGSQKHRDPRFPPYAFTEHGAIMAATTLNSRRAVEMSLYVVRAFVRLRELLATNRALARKLDELERRLHTHDEAIAGILRTLRGLMDPPASERRGIGFTADLEEGS
jgi:ORF6N domain